MLPKNIWITSNTLMLVNIAGEKNDYDIIEIIKNSYGNVNLQNGEMSETEITVQGCWSDAPNSNHEHEGK